MSPLLLVTTVTVSALGIWGGRPERTAAVLFTALVLITPLVQPLSVGQWRWGVAITSLFTFSGLLWLALKCDRWWLIFAAGCQLLALFTHMISLLLIDSLVWTAVTLRWISWGGVLACAVFGVWEGRTLERLRRTARGADDDAKVFHENLERGMER